MPVPDYDQMVAKVAYARVNRPDAQQCAGSKILQKKVPVICHRRVG